VPIIGAYEAKTRFPELLDRAEKGERFTITRHGKAVAEIVPAVTHVELSNALLMLERRGRDDAQ
jgi:prevent-host-death family protein